MTRRVLVAARGPFDRAERTFWRGLRDALAARDLRLVMACSVVPPGDLEVEHIRTTASLDAFCAETEAPQLPAALLGLDEDLLLDREAMQSGPPLLDAVERLRRDAVRRLAAQQLQRLAIVRPVLTIACNRLPVDQELLVAASAAGGTPIMYADRSGIADLVFVSEESRDASRASLRSAGEESRAAAQRLCQQLARARSGWWQQPRSRAGSPQELRAALGIPSDARVLLFAAPPDDEEEFIELDARRRSRVEVFEWLLQCLALCPGIYVLGRQHPRSRVPARCYAERLARSGIPGAWRDDLSLEDALLVCDRVAAAESSVVIDAMARRRPTLALSGWLLSGHGAVYEAASHPHAAVYEWLAAYQFDARVSRFHDALGALLRNHLYTHDTTMARVGASTLDVLADRVRDKAASSPWHVPDSVADWVLPPRAEPAAAWLPNASAAERRHELQERLQQWELAHTLRSALLPAYHAARDGRAVRVWGSATARQAVVALLAAAGAAVDVQAIGARDVEAPHLNFTVVATAAHDETTQQLESMGFVRGRDYTVVEPQLLHALRVGARVRGDAA